MDLGRVAQRGERRCVHPAVGLAAPEQDAIRIQQIEADFDRKIASALPTATLRILKYTSAIFEIARQKFIELPTAPKLSMRPSKMASAPRGPRSLGRQQRACPGSLIPAVRIASKTASPDTVAQPTAPAEAKTPTSRRASLTLAQLSGLADIDAGFLHYIEVGKKTPSLATLAKLAGALEVPVSDLFAGAEAQLVAEPTDSRIARQLRSLLRGKSPDQKEDLLTILKALGDPGRAKALRRVMRG